MTPMAPQLIRARRPLRPANEPFVDPCELSLARWMLTELGEMDLDAEALEDFGLDIRDHTDVALRWVMAMGNEFDGGSVTAAQRLDLAKGLVRSVREQDLQGRDVLELARTLAPGRRRPNTVMWVDACRWSLWEADERRVFVGQDVDFRQLFDCFGVPTGMPTLIAAIVSEMDSFEGPVALENDGRACVGGVLQTWTTTLELLDRLDPALGWRHRLRFQGPQLLPRNIDA